MPAAYIFLLLLILLKQTLMVWSLLVFPKSTNADTEFRVGPGVQKEFKIMSIVYTQKCQEQLQFPRANSKEKGKMLPKNLSFLALNLFMISC